jgi:hypothetical protein
MNEFAAIITFLVVFIALFVWLTQKSDQQIYQYYKFALLSTLVLSGLLKAVGVYKNAVVALGGSIVVFGVFFDLTKSSFESHDNIKGTLERTTQALESTTQALTAAQNDVTQRQKILDQLRDELKSRIFNRDLVVFTYGTDNAIVHYFGSKGDPKIAKKEGPNKHTIDWRDFDPVKSIQFDIDQAPTPPERSFSTPSVRIDYISFGLDRLDHIDQFDPVIPELQAYLKVTNQDSSCSGSSNGALSCCCILRDRRSARSCLRPISSLSGRKLLRYYLDQFDTRG